MPFVRKLLQFAVVLVIAVVGNVVATQVADNWLLSLLSGLAIAGAALAGYVFVVRRTERRRVTELALTDAGPGLGRGALLGVLMIAAVMASISLLGGYHVHGFGSLSAALGIAGAMVAVTVTEELILRGLLLRWIERRAGSWVGLLVTAPLFGALHLLNPDATLWGAVAITLEAGALLGAAYLATRNLWFPIGLHAAWNIAQSAIFGASTSGNGTPQGLLDASTSGPVLLSGGAFGPEASAFAVLAGLIGATVLIVVAKRRGHWVPLGGMRAAGPAPARTDGASGTRSEVASRAATL